LNVKTNRLTPTHARLVAAYRSLKTNLPYLFIYTLFPIFIAFSVKFISPEQLSTFLILFSGTLGIMGIITPYGTGPSPIWYGSGYISQGRWWFLGAIFGALYLSMILLGVFIFL
jgi:L-tartrate/succinate antiporter